MTRHGKAEFDTAIARELGQRISPSADARLAEGVSALVVDLHRCAMRLSLAPSELARVLHFLSDVGEACHEHRNEWVLLADALGLSTLVEEISSDGATTPATLRGPFYRSGAPDIPNGGSLVRDGSAHELHLAFSVTNTNGTALPGARVEIWHANADGLYENQDPDGQPEFNLRGVLTSDRSGRVWCQTQRPGPVVLPTDGPVGDLMQLLGLPASRPAHLHLRITSPGHRDLVTHLFDASDPRIGLDALFVARPALAISFAEPVAYTFVLACEEDSDPRSAA